MTIFSTPSNSSDVRYQYLGNPYPSESTGSSMINISEMVIVKRVLTKRPYDGTTAIVAFYDEQVKRIRSLFKDDVHLILDPSQMPSHPIADRVFICLTAHRAEPTILETGFLARALHLARRDALVIGHGDLFDLPQASHRFLKNHNS